MSKGLCRGDDRGLSFCPAEPLKVLKGSQSFCVVLGVLQLRVKIPGAGIGDYQGFDIPAGQFRGQTFSMAGSPPENPESGVRGRGSGNEGAKEGVGGFLNRAQSE